MTIDVDVLVVGAGPVGLATAIELGHRGIKVLLVEQNERGGVAPRAKTTNVRTRTHLRRWGIADKLAAEAPFGVDYPNNMVFVTSLAGYELARFGNAFNAAPVRSDLYPEHAQWIPQYALEKVMLAHARTLPGVEIRFGTTFQSGRQSDTGVESDLLEGGAALRVRSRYLVGADGARSTVRELIGAKMEGRRGLSRSYNIIFRAPGLADEHQHGPAAIYWQLGRHGLSAIGPMDRDDVWFFMPRLAEGQTLSHDEAAALIATHTGIDLPYEVLSADSWSANELLADRYSDGHIFLAGDACHLHPPTGGYGMNMGVGDGVDLGWKIAAMLKGWGGNELLESYEIERRPVHRKVIEEAVVNLGAVGMPPAGISANTADGARLRQAIGAQIQATKGREFHTLGTVLGLSYEGSPLIAREDGEAPPHDGAVYKPTARAGSLAPHAWLRDGRSLYDLFGSDFTLLVAANAGAGEVAQAEADATRLGIPLSVVRPVGIDVAALYGAPLALVRPDQHVAWRGSSWNHPLTRAAGRG